MATKALKDKIRKHIEDHLCITDEYAKVAYNVDDLRPIINDLIQLDGMNITSADALEVLRYSVGLPANEKIGTTVTMTAA